MLVLSSASQFFFSLSAPVFSLSPKTNLIGDFIFSFRCASDFNSSGDDDDEWWKPFVGRWKRGVKSQVNTLCNSRAVEKKYRGLPSTDRLFDRLFLLWKFALLIVAISLD